MWKQILSLVIIFSLIYAWFTPSVHASDLTQGLVSCWTFDESSTGAGAVTRNDSFGSNHLTDNNTTVSATGKIGNGADFENTNNEYLSIADGSQTGLDNLTTFSASGWVRFETDTSATNHAFVAKYDSGALTSSYATRFMRNPTENVTMETSSSGLESGGGFTQSTIAFSGNHSTATWYFITITYNAGTVRVYRDGVLQNTNTGFQTTIADSSAPFMVGRNNLADTGQDFDGIIDELTFYNTQLSQSQIDELYNGGSGMSCASIIATGGAQGTPVVPTSIYRGNVQMSGNILIR